jgi:hypothetical protein
MQKTWGIPRRAMPPAWNTLMVHVYVAAQRADPACDIIGARMAASEWE